MITFFILEKEDQIRSDIEEEIKRYAHGHRLDINIKMSTREADVFLRTIEEQHSESVYLIDGDASLEQKNAIDLGSVVRTQNNRSFLIYMGDPGKLMDVIWKSHLEVLDIIVKDPYRKETVQEEIIRCLDTIQERKQNEKIAKLYAVYNTGKREEYQMMK